MVASATFCIPLLSLVGAANCAVFRDHVSITGAGSRLVLGKGGTQEFELSVPWLMRTKNQIAMLQAAVARFETDFGVHNAPPRSCVEAYQQSTVWIDPDGTSGPLPAKEQQCDFGLMRDMERDGLSLSELAGPAFSSTSGVFATPLLGEHRSLYFENEIAGGGWVAVKYMKQSGSVTSASSHVDGNYHLSQPVLKV